jgi:hypothetical protein
VRRLESPSLAAMSLRLSLLFLALAVPTATQAQILPLPDSTDAGALHGDVSHADSTHGVPLDRMPTGAERAHLLRKEVVAPRFVAGVFLGGTVAHVVDAPDAWGDDGWDYAARVGSNAGGGLVFAGTEYGLAAALRIDTRYRPLKRGGTGRRIWHALQGSVTAHTADGGRVVNIPTASGLFVSGLARSAWETGEMHPIQNAIGTIFALGVGRFVGNLFDEF